jgi:hypothetical protein
VAFLNLNILINTREYFILTDIWTTLYTKDIPVTGSGGPYGYESSRLPHYLDKRLRDGGKVVSPTRRPALPPGFFFKKPGTHFC